jgi:hypothetical protein
MSETTEVEPSVKAEIAEKPVDDFLWGAAQIGKAIHRNGRQAHHLLTTGQIKSARKVGGLWCANRAALLREFGA